MLRFNHFEPATGVFGRDVFQTWADEVGKATDGRVMVEVYPSAALGAPPAWWDRVKTGITDIEFGTPDWITGTFPLHTLTALPMLGFDTIATSNKLVLHMYDKFPEFRAEAYEMGAHACAQVNTGTNQIATTERTIYTKEDVKGLKLRISGKPIAQFVEAMEAAPMFMPVSEVYVGMERGVIDGLLMSMIGWRGFRLLDLINNVIKIDLCDNSAWITMNQGSWDSLPADIQEEIEKVNRRWSDEVHPQAGDGERAACEAEMIKLGKVVFYPSAAEEARWKATAQPIQDAWVVEMEGLGLPGQAIMDEAIAFIEAEAAKE